MCAHGSPSEPELRQGQTQRARSPRTGSDDPRPRKRCPSTGFVRSLARLSHLRKPAVKAPASRVHNRPSVSSGRVRLRTELAAAPCLGNGHRPARAARPRAIATSLLTVVTVGDGGRRVVAAYGQPRRPACTFKSAGPSGQVANVGPDLQARPVIFSRNRRRRNVSPDSGEHRRCVGPSVTRRRARCFAAMSTESALGPRSRDFVPAALLRLASDRRLVEQFQAGSGPAFEALFDRHRGPVLAFCRRMLTSPDEAEDAMQQTFLAAYSELVRAETPRALRPWLYAIARHRCLAMLRARRERPGGEPAEAATDDLFAEVDHARGSARAPDRRGAAAGRPAHRHRARRAGWHPVRGDRAAARVPAREGEGARVPGAVLARRRPRRAGRRRAPRSVSSSRRSAVAHCGAPRSAATSAIARAAGRSATRSAGSAAG